MLFESKFVRVTAEHGTATLWLDFPGEPVNALDLERLRTLDAATAAVEVSPFIDILVVRSAKPAGFCAGLHPRAILSLDTVADRAAFAWVGQQVFDRLANLACTTVAFIDGPCLSAGLELALACDHRLCLSRPTTHLGFPDAPKGVVPGFGGSIRLRAKLGRRAADRLLASGKTLSGREARAIGLVDHAFCERRGKIELRSFLNVLELRGPQLKRSRPLVGFAEERQTFARALGTKSASVAARRSLRSLQPLDLFPPPINPVPPFPDVVGQIGDDAFASRVAATAAMLGRRVVLAGSGGRLFAAIDAMLARGFITPLEAEQARGRIAKANDRESLALAGLVLVSAEESMDDLDDVLSPTCVVVVTNGSAAADLPYPRRLIGMRASEESVSLLRFPGTDSDTVAALASWLREIEPAAAVQVHDALPAFTRDLVAA